MHQVLCWGLYIFFCFSINSHQHFFHGHEGLTRAKGECQVAMRKNLMVEVSYEIKDSKSKYGDLC